jgi:hypothetical protein
VKRKREERAMRKLGPALGIAIAISLLSGQVSVAQPPPPPGGRPHRLRQYGGETSQAQPIFIKIVRAANGWRLAEADFGFRMRCQDGSKYRLGLGIGWFGGGPRLDDHGRFSVDEVDPFDALHFHGRLGPHRGSGTVEFTEPALTQDEQAMRCTSKERTWSVVPAVDVTPPPPPTPVPNGSSSSRSMFVRIDANGKAHVTSS